MAKNFSASDIRPPHTMIEQEEAIAKDVAWLTQHRNNFVRVNCPICDEDNARLEFERKGFCYVRCQHCFCVYTNPRPKPDLLKEFYENSAVYSYWSENIYRATSDNRRKYLFRPRAELLVEKCKNMGFEDAIMLEVGSSQGGFCEEIKNLNFFRRVIGVEITPDQVRISRENGVETYQSSYEDFVIDKEVHAIASFETIEHLFSPFDFFTWAFNALAADGFLMLSCPNFSGFEALVLGKNAGCVDHEHLNYFDPSSITKLATRCGFRDIEITTPGVLDVEIVERGLRDGFFDNNKLGEFLADIILSGDENNKMHLQNFLQNISMSSSMLFVARKA